MSQAGKTSEPEKTPFGLIRTNFKGVFYFQLLFRIMSVAILFPILTYTKNLILSANKVTSITMANALEAAKNPLTWMILILIVLLVTVFVCIEQFGGISLLYASWKDKKYVTARDAFHNGVDMAIAGFIPANLIIIFYILIICPFSSYFDTSSITRYIRIPGFILEHFTKYPAVGYAFYAAMVLVAFLALRLVYVMDIMYVEKKTFTEACRISWQMTKGKKMLSLVFSILSYLCLLALFFIASMILIPSILILITLWLEPGTDYTRFITEQNFYILIIGLTLFYGLIYSPIMQSVFACRYFHQRSEEGIELPAYNRHQVHFLKRKWIRAFWAVFCAVVVFFSVPNRWRQFKWILNGNSNDVMIMAHRGYSAAAPENTIPAFRAAYEAGATAIELDVQMTKDGEIVVMHDDNTLRTTGENHNIWEVTYDEIKKLDNGSFFSDAFSGTTIPTLEEAINYCRGRLYMNIEIKRNGHDEGIGDKVVEIIRRNNFQNECDITSQDYATLEDIHSKYPDILLAYTSVLGIGQIKDLAAVDIISIQETFANYETVESMHMAGKKVFAWTVNESETMENLIAINVDAILTNDPVLGNKVLAEHQGIADKFKRIQQILYYFS